MFIDPLAGLAFAADVMHAIVVEDDLHATVAIGDFVRLIERLGVLEDLRVLELLGGQGVSFLLLVDKIILPGNYLKAHSYFQIIQNSFRII